MAPCKAVGRSYRVGAGSGELRRQAGSSHRDGSGRFLDGSDSVHGEAWDRVASGSELRRRRSVRYAARQENTDGVRASGGGIAGKPRRLHGTTAEILGSSRLGTCSERQSRLGTIDSILRDGQEQAV